MAGAPGSRGSAQRQPLRAAAAGTGARGARQSSLRIAACLPPLAPAENAQRRPGAHSGKLNWQFFSAPTSGSNFGALWQPGLQGSVQSEARIPLQSAPSSPQDARCGARVLSERGASAFGRVWRLGGGYRRPASRWAQRSKRSSHWRAQSSRRACLGDYPREILRSFIMKCTAQEWLQVTAVLFMARAIPAMVVPNATFLEKLLEKYMDEDGEWWTAKQRGKRAIMDDDMQSILDLHNKLRSQVYPTASNMEYMTWDVELERSAEAWAETCLWEHGPANLLPLIGQNLGAHWGRYRPPTFHVQAWYDEVKDFSYPYEHECNPYCPFKCSGPVCTHYTQVVWATSNRIGCAINLCHNMNIWGQIWPKAIYLVCNYSPKETGGAMPPTNMDDPVLLAQLVLEGAVGKICATKSPLTHDDLTCNRKKHCPVLSLLDDEGSNSYYSPREEETNEIERQQSQVRDIHVQTTADDSDRNEVVSTQQMSQIVSCEVRLRDQCKGTTCNRYECPAGCLDSKAKVIGSVHYEMQSSICRAAIHYGIIDNDGGWVDITRQGRKHYFIKSKRNGVQSIGKYQSANSFTVSKVTVQAVTCETTVEQLCSFHKPASHCPRVYCPHNCMQANPHYARVIGNRIYSDMSSICRAAIHAGVVRNHGGYVDIMPVDKRKTYTASFQNGIFSESLQNPPGGKAFRIFAVL